MTSRVGCLNKNNDGIDIDGCKNVVVNDCIVDSDDAAIAIGERGPIPYAIIAATGDIWRPGYELYPTSCGAAARKGTANRGNSAAGGR